MSKDLVRYLVSCLFGIICIGILYQFNVRETKRADGYHGDYLGLAKEYNEINKAKNETVMAYANIKKKNEVLSDKYRNLLMELVRYERKLEGKKLAEKRLELHDILVKYGVKYELKKD